MTDTLIWISGASTGLGRALAETVPDAGAHVVDISRSGGTPGAEHLPADLSDPASWGAVAAHFQARLEHFTGERALFIHNAGTLEPMGFAGEVDTEGYRDQVLLNAAAPQVLGHAFVKAAWSFAGRSDLVLLTSGAATRPYEGWSAYCAGKAAVDMWVRTVGAEQVRREGRTHVLAVAPGILDTGMQEQIRAMSERDFPDVGKYREQYERGALRPPADAARDIWALLDRGLDNGAVVDLRKLSSP
jgi:benzil reductase ((S)-benzoin forming)